MFFTSLAFIGLMALIPGKRVSLYTSTSEFARRRTRFTADIATVLKWIADGSVKPIVARVLPLAEAAEAHRLLESGAAGGKIVLRVAR